MVESRISKLCLVVSEVDRGKITIGYDSNDHFVVYVSGEKATARMAAAAQLALDLRYIARGDDGRLAVTAEGLACMRRNWPTWRPTQ